MDVIAILMRVLPLAMEIVAAVEGYAADPEGTVATVTGKALAAAELITGRDLLNDEVVVTAARETVQAFFAAKAVVETRPQSAS